MNYQNLFKIAIRAIAANKMRSFLTALGIIIGIAAVITMLAIGQGSKASIKANIAEMGSNMIMISPGADMRGGVRQDASSMETLKQADYQSIKEDCNYISAISPTVNSSGQWIYGNNNTQSSIYGVNQDYLSIRQLKVADGEMFTDTDIKAAAKVCILGQTVVDYLFPDGSDPIGKVVRFNSIPFRVASGQGGTTEDGAKESRDYIESPYSKRSYIDYQDNIYSIKNSLYGTRDVTATTPVTNSMMNIMKKYNYSGYNDINTALNEAIAALETAKNSSSFVADIAAIEKAYKNGTINSEAAYTRVKTCIDKINNLDDELNKAGAWFRKIRASK